MMQLRCIAALFAVVIVAPSLALAPSLAFAQREPPPMSDSRLLRRVHLTLLGRAPTVEEYEAFLALPEGDRRSAIADFATAAMADPAFGTQVRLWAHDYLGVPGYFGSRNIHTYQFDGALSMVVGPCGDGTLHAGRLGLLNDSGSAPVYGQDVAICNDPNAPTAEIEPWWAPGTTVPTIGDVATENAVSVNGEDCAQNRATFRGMEGCGCGPNLIYCAQRPIAEEGDYYIANSMRRQVHEEPSRLFEFIVTANRPFSDLIAGDYTVATRTLRMAYMRQARMTPETASMDQTDWWRAYGTNPDEWREIKISELHPLLLDDRNYAFDPRSESGRPIGVPSAGVLTTIVANQAWPRERVRAAAWIKSLTCREFTPPASDVAFPEYERDPGTEGACAHCHQTIDPAAMYFKRFFDAGVFLAGVTDTWSLNGQVSGATFRLNGHARGAMVANTLMTPVTEEQLQAQSDVRFVDFMPPGTTLFGTAGSGTIGPLGFAEVLIASGEFDRCAVRRAYERFGGRDLLPGRDDVLLDQLHRSFVENDRSMQRLIQEIVAADEFSLGI
ncbi:MAG: DUF1549 domain-containing protein [Myxococcota bacterium]